MLISATPLAQPHEREDSVKDIGISTESEQMVARVRENGTPVWYLMATDEGHGFAKKPNADFQFYATVMFVRQFLLGG